MNDFHDDWEDDFERELDNPPSHLEWMVVFSIVTFLVIFGGFFGLSFLVDALS